MDIDLTFLLHENMKKTLSDIQAQIKEEIEFITGFYLTHINVNAMKVIMNIPRESKV